jgi:hypothetical protein
VRGERQRRQKGVAMDSTVARVSLP